MLLSTLSSFLEDLVKKGNKELRFGGVFCFSYILLEFKI
jgi:hypothetical protein